jgi:hypothetical protein
MGIEVSFNNYTCSIKTFIKTILINVLLHTLRVFIYK